MRYLFLSFISLLFFISCGKDAPLVVEPEVANPEVMDPEVEEPTKSATSYLALGDSYTIGQSVPYELNYPSQLYERLIADDIAVDPPTIIARTGWTTNDLAAAINQADPDSTYCLVSLAIGVNNQFRGEDTLTYAEDFERLLNQAITFANGDHKRVFVLSIPDYGFTPFGQRMDPEQIGKELDQFNAINKRITEEYEVKYFDITPISREGLDRTELVADDRLHPSALQYEEWVDVFYTEIKEEMLLKL